MTLILPAEIIFLCALTGQLQLLYPPPQFSKRSGQLFLNVRCVHRIIRIRNPTPMPSQAGINRPIVFRSLLLDFLFGNPPPPIAFDRLFFMFAACPVH